MKKNKTVAYALAATLLVGGTFLGTKALFTDRVDDVGELAISTGDVDIEVLESSQWELARNGNEHYDGTTVGGDTGTTEGTLPDGGDAKDLSLTPFANNLKPGDVLTKTVTVKNEGTLIAELGIIKDETKMKQQLGVLSGLIDASNGELNKKTLKPGEQAEVNLTLTVKDEESLHNISGHNKDDIENTVVKLTDAWTLTAKQQNTKIQNPLN